MNILKKLLIFALCFGTAFITLSSVLDDPEHLFSPDPDCPLCQALKTGLYFTKTSIELPVTILFVFYTDIFQSNLYIISVITNLSIRAPPQS